MTLTLTLPIGEFLYTGRQVTFEAPCASEGLTGLIVDGITYDLVNSLGTGLVGNSFDAGAMVSVIFNVNTRKAYVQNADTNAYLEGRFNELGNGANKYTHPETHPASMITDTDDFKIMTVDERVKLSNIEEGANKYTHTETHPASMIDGLKDFVLGLGAGGCATGSYLGDGSGENKYNSMNGVEWGNSGSTHRTISLPFTPSVIVIFDTASKKMNFAISGNYGYEPYEYSAGASNQGISYAPVFHLTGNELHVVHKCFYGSSTSNYVNGSNTSGQTYQYLIV